jgi:hypothetical protein
MTITYDDPFNLKDARSYRASLGFLLPSYDPDLIKKFQKLHYQWKSLPKAKSLYGTFPYRNAASLSFGATRFLPTCLNYLMRNQRRFKDILNGDTPKAGTIEVIENGNVIRYYLVIEMHREFMLTTKGQPELKNEGKFTSIYYKKND